MAGSGIIAFRAGVDFDTALARAARVHGGTKTDLIIAWLGARLVAEGFLILEGDDDGEDQTRQRTLDNRSTRGVDQADAAPLGHGLGAHGR